MPRDTGFDQGDDAWAAQTSGGGTTATAPTLAFSTASEPAARQFAFWQHCNHGLVDVARDVESDDQGFTAAGSLWRLGGLALSSGAAEACRYRRAATHIRRDSLDHWVVSVIRRGTRSLRSDDRVVINDPGAPVITSFDRPYETMRDDSAWLQLYIPRDTLPALGQAIDLMRFRRLDGAMGALLQDYILLLAARTPRLSAAEAARLADATGNMVAACIQPSAELLQQAAPQIELVQLAQIKRLIRHNLGSAMLGPDRLCRQAGVSRSKLYRMFEPFGGVARFIQSERLARAHAALSDPDDIRSIGRIAEDVGLFDLSSFGRMFRASFGCSPRELRLTVATGTARPAPARQNALPAVGGLQAMLRGL
jgi:AraC-like DNA-binding protein